MSDRIEGFIPHRGKHRISILLDAPDAVKVSALAESRGVPSAAVARDMVLQSLADTRIEGPPVREWTTDDGRRVAIYEWPVTAKEGKE